MVDDLHLRLMNMVGKNWSKEPHTGLQILEVVRWA
jgi:hypothetical protein